LRKAAKGGSSLFFELPKNFTSENVLKMRVLDPKNAAAGQKVAIVKGKGGRTLLKEALWARGWGVEEVEVYRRVRRARCEGWEQFRKAQKPLVLAMSVEAIEALQGALDKESSQWIKQQPVVALSERIEMALREQGWQAPIHVAEQSDGSGMINLLQQLSLMP
jgi:uroporphyrinogen-III synthase